MFPLYYTGQGKRKSNEDYFLSFQIDNLNVIGVADGVGGNKDGEIASQTALEIFKKKFTEQYKKIDIKNNIEHSIKQAHEAVLDLHEVSNESNGNMATTLTVGIIHNEEILIGHVGDSRVYLIRENGIKQLTEDDTELNDLINKGLITKAQAINYPRKNILTNAIGIKDNFNFQLVEFKLKKKDRIIFLTDGFYGSLTKEEFRDISRNNFEFSNFFYEIVNKCQNYYPSDNFTAVAIEI